jgi:hypothetical protein
MIVCGLPQMSLVPNCMSTTSGRVADDPAGAVAEARAGPPRGHEGEHRDERHSKESHRVVHTVPLSVNTAGVTFGPL